MIDFQRGGGGRSGEIDRFPCIRGNQCWGSVTFWYGSVCGSSDPYLWLTDPDTGGPKTYGSECKFETMVHLHNSSKIKSHKKLQNSIKQVLFTILAWWWKDPEPDQYLWLMDQDADLDPQHWKKKKMSSMSPCKWERQDEKYVQKLYRYIRQT